jgi:TonB family protein
MKLPSVFAFFAWTLAAVPMPASARDVPLQPIKPWVLDYAETECAAVRDYGDAQNPTTLVIRPAAMGNTYQLQVVRSRNGNAYADEEPGTVDFGFGPINSALLRFRNDHGKLEIYSYRITSAEMQAARPASSVTFRMAGGKFASFALDSIPELLNGLVECNEDLRRYWNVENTARVTVSKPAKGDVRPIFTANDYPAAAVSAGEEGSAQFLLFIGTQGEVAACDVLKPSGVALLDAMGCAVIQKRAKFVPSRDAAGQPMRDSYVTPDIIWRLAG